jgi:hypothetical protein
MISGMTGKARITEVPNTRGVPIVRGSSQLSMSPGEHGFERPETLVVPARMVRGWPRSRFLDARPGAEGNHRLGFGSALWSRSERQFRSDSTVEVKPPPWPFIMAMVRFCPALNDWPPVIYSANVCPGRVKMAW